MITLMILSCVLVVTLGAVSLIMAGIVATRLEQSSIIAYYAAETGIERALWEYKEGSFSMPEASGLIASSALGNNSNYIVNYASSTNNIAFISLGAYNESKRSIQVNFE